MVRHFHDLLIGLRAFDLVSSRVWWEAATNTRHFHDLVNNRTGNRQQVSRTLLSILAYLINVVVWIVSCPLIPESSSRLWGWFRAHQLQLVSPSLSCSIVVVFFNSLTRSKYLSLFSFSFNFTLWSAGTVKSTIWQVFFYWLLQGLVFCPGLGDLFVSQNSWELNASHSPEENLGWAYIIIIIISCLKPYYRVQTNL